MGGGMSRDRNKNWDLEAIADHEGSINVMAVSEDRSVLVTGAEDCTARLWNTEGAETECMGILRGHTNYITTIGTVGVFVITGSADNSIRKWDMYTCACLFVYEGHTSRVTRVLCTADFIISSSYDKTCKLWLFETDDDDDSESTCIRTFEGHTAGVYPICFIPGDDEEKPDKPLAGNGGEGDQEAEPEPEKEDEDLEEGIHPRDVLITGAADGTARSWSVAKGIQLKVFKGHKGPVSCMAIDATGKLLYTSGPDKTVREWDIEQGVCTKLLSGHKDSVICMQVVNKLMYTGSADTTARCFITEFGDCTRTYKSHRDTVICLRFHNGILFTGCADMIARAFDARSGNLKRTYTGHEAAINCMHVVGKKLYTGSSDGVLRVWDADVPVDEISEIEAIEANEPSATVDDAGAAPPGAAEHVE
ncbi:WD repeat-containing protein 86-like isoform X2 [Pollicipes pollicipes]|uniref:WD repeat-containing protein 86-like isoform X2 n=1 Tax=Pollicipes pollicipes TaxID=41117 RepID=UPI0018851CAF|nr:WD repeat-containing protein 86-like isoform X2 [Pollicipes pollicipes]